MRPCRVRRRSEGPLGRAEGAFSRASRIEAGRPGLGIGFQKTLVRRLGADWLFRRRIRFLFEPLRRLRPLACSSDGPAEIHSLVSHRHLEIYLLAIRSFLRFYDRVRVVVHDDGTMGEKDIRFLEDRIRNVRIVRKRESDRLVEECLRGHPSCLRFRRKQVLTAQVFDFPRFAETRKIVALDSDILVLRHPAEIVRWIEEETGEILYAYEENPRSPRIRKRNITLEASTPFRFAPHLCGGFVCAYAEIFDLDLIERYCSYVLANCHDRLYRAQTIAALCAANSPYRVRPLPPTYQNLPHFRADPEPVLRHYFLSLSRWKPYLRDARAVLAEMERAEAFGASG